MTHEPGRTRLAASLLSAAPGDPDRVFYILKIRLRRVPVSTVIFWRQIFEEKKPRSLWQRLRHLLSLLRAARACWPCWSSRWPSRSSLERPEARAARPGHRQLGQHERDRRRAEPAGGGEGRGPAGHRRPAAPRRDGDRRRRHAAAGRLRADRPPADPPRGASTRSRRPTARPSVAEAVALARRLVADADKDAQGRSSCTDGGFEDAAELAKAEDVAARRRRAGRPANVGITRFQVRRSLIDPIGYEILVEVTNPPTSRSSAGSSSTSTTTRSTSSR